MDTTQLEALMRPKLEEITRQLKSIQTWCEEPCGTCKACEDGEDFDCRTNRPTSIDVRLQVHKDGSWCLHSGDSSYDQDHRGYWGSDSVMKHTTDLADMAQNLLEQALEMASQDGE